MACPGAAQKNKIVGGGICSYHKIFAAVILTGAPAFGAKWKDP
jgi:hypothetical protein